MSGSSPEDDGYSTPDLPPRPRPWVRVIASLGIFAFLVGLMLGRLMQPEPQWLRDVSVTDQGLALWFDEEPKPVVASTGGVFIMRIESFGKERNGQLQIAGHAANWRIERERRDLLLRVVAARPLQGTWRAQEADGRWRLEISLSQ
ncbi:hypothetical protein WG219_01695 [Ectopseudomonas mendocina]|uniref:Uncharacterized protein n=1 Tax=Ectopseudomonas mendocina TaxID=300 RepID=A0ABZ2RKT8_ECTME